MAKAATITAPAPLPLSHPRHPRHYKPYHSTGEVLFLLTIALIGIILPFLPLNFYILLILAVVVYTLLPVVIIRDYWPKLSLHQLGWRRPERPRHLRTYTLMVLLLAFLPLVIWLSVAQPVNYVSVLPTASWLDWLTAEALVAVILLATAGFFSGIVLFRLTHHLGPAMAIIVVGVIMGAGQYFMPGSLRLLTLPVAIVLNWMAWETHSFAPAAVTQILLALTYDFYVRLTV